MLILSADCHITIEGAPENEEKASPPFLPTSTYAFPLFLHPLCSIAAAVHCSALLCFRVRHEIPSLGTWGGGHGREGGSDGRERELREGREGRQLGVGRKEGREHAYLLSPQKEW